MEKKLFGKSSRGENVYLYTLTNENNMKVELINYGARLVSVLVKGKDEKLYDVVLGYDNLRDYENDNYCFGATIGRNANRTKDAKFTLNGTTYHLSKNENNNNCHSGPSGYEHRVWDGEIIDDNAVRFSLISPAMDQGFPGEFKISVTYRLTSDNSIQIFFNGISTEDTVVNMTNHTYFNLSGHDSGAVLEQYLYINSDEYSPIENEESIPTGVRESVKDTPMDFRTFKKIGRDINLGFEQLMLAGDYNHSFHINKGKGELGLMAEAYSEKSGIRLRAFSDLPDMQFYAGFYINDCMGKKSYTYESRAGFCLEAQYTPNAMNADTGDKPIVRQNEEYFRRIYFQFL